MIHTISLAQTDAAGVLFCGELLPLVHAAYEQWITQKLALTWGQWFNNPDWIVPIRRVETDFLRPIRGGQTVAIQIEVERVGTSSITLSARVVCEGQTAATARTVHVFCDRKSGQPIDVPSYVSDALADLACT